MKRKLRHSMLCLILIAAVVGNGWAVAAVPPGSSCGPVCCCLVGGTMQGHPISQERVSASGPGCCSSARPGSCSLAGGLMRNLPELAVSSTGSDHRFHPLCGPTPVDSLFRAARVPASIRSSLSESGPPGAAPPYLLNSVFII